MNHDPLIDAAVRRVPDFPKPGILFYDITSILLSPRAFARCIEGLASACREFRVEALAPIESRGFLFAGPLAKDLSLPIVPVRKKGKLPGKTVTKSYELEYGNAEIEMHALDIPKGRRVAVLDDLIATGGTIRAAADLLSEGGAIPVCAICVIGLPFLKYEERLAGLPVRTLQDYAEE
jgi:adenine phosphoribosyltransferase